MKADHLTSSGFTSASTIPTKAALNSSQYKLGRSKPCFKVDFSFKVWEYTLDGKR